MNINNYKFLLRVNPRLIVRINRDFIMRLRVINIDELIQYAFDHGYKPKEKDLINNKILCESRVMQAKLKEKNSTLVKYCYFDYSSNLIDSELDKIIVSSIMQGKTPEQIVYENPRLLYTVRFDISENEMKRIISSGFKIDIENIINNQYLLSNDELFRYIIDNNITYFKYYRGIKNELFDYAISKGFIPDKEVLKKGNFLSSSKILEKAYDKMTLEEVQSLINSFFSSILYHENEEFILKLIILGDDNKGLKPQIDRLSSDSLKDTLKKYSSIFIGLLKQGYNIDEDILKHYSNNYNVFLEIASIKPELIEYYDFKSNNEGIDIFKTALSHGYNPSMNIVDILMNKNIVDFDLWIYAHSIGYKPNEDLKIIFEYLDNPDDYSLVEEYSYNTDLMKLAIERFDYEIDIDVINDKNIKILSKDIIKDLLIEDENAKLLDMLSVEAFEEIIKNADLDYLYDMLYILGLNLSYVSSSNFITELNIVWDKILKINPKQFDDLFEPIEDTFSFVTGIEFNKNICLHLINNVSINTLYKIYFDSLIDNETHFFKIYNIMLQKIKESDIKNFANYLIKYGSQRIIFIDDIELFNEIVNYYDYRELCFVIVSSKNIEINKCMYIWKRINQLYNDNLSDKDKKLYNLVKQTIVNNEIPLDMFENIINSFDDVNNVDVSFYANIFANLSKVKNNSEKYDLLLKKLRLFNIEEEVIRMASNQIKENIINVSKSLQERLINNMNYENLLISLNLSNRLSSNICELIWNRICNVLNKDISYGYFSIIKDNKIKDFFDNYPGDNKFYETFGFSLFSLFKYAPNNYNQIINIYKDGKINEFLDVYNYFKDNGLIEENESELIKVRVKLDLLNSYLKNPSIYSEIIKKDNLTESEKESIKNSLSFLSIVKMDDKNVKNLNDLYNIRQKYFESYKEKIDKASNLDSLKDEVCQMMFFMTFKEVREKLDKYGNTEDFKITAFNNRNNEEIQDDLLNIIYIVRIMEDVAECRDMDALRNYANNLLSNYDEAFEMFSFYSEFDEIMRDFYEKELNVNATKIKSENVDLTPILDKEMSDEIGIDVIDLMDKQYCLYFHKVSGNESIHDLMIGTDEREFLNSKMLAISLSSGSHRGLNIYRYSLSKSDIILITDEIPLGKFVKSSSVNLGSNGSIQNAFSKGRSDSNKQRGALEISVTPSSNDNSEILCFREGIKFKYIALLGGRKPTTEEIELAREYGLKFVKVQENDKIINNPKKIDEEFLEKKEVKINNRISRKNLNTSSLHKNERRKVAIFADAHAFYEPTLAILEDARKNGIDEIYSLGDNIGTGPSPKEVLDLLKEYGVKSIKGNHELYALGIDRLPLDLKRHIGDGYIKEEATRNSEYANKELTQEQLKEIASYPEDRIIELGGKKIYLTHYTNKYDGSKKEIPQGVNEVLQGHIHKDENEMKDNVAVKTLGGVGVRIGMKKPSAYYIILSETEDGYEMEVKEVEYNSKNLYQTINESGLEGLDKFKAYDWSKAQRR